MNKNSNLHENDSMWVLFDKWEHYSNYAQCFWFNSRQEARDFKEKNDSYGERYSTPIKYTKDF